MPGVDRTMIRSVTSLAGECQFKSEWCDKHAMEVTAALPLPGQPRRSRGESWHGFARLGGNLTLKGLMFLLLRSHLSC